MYDIKADVCPWQVDEFDRLTRLHQQGMLPHAILLSAGRCFGKRAFGKALGEYLLCARPKESRACGNCPECLLVAAGTHPDLFILTPEESKVIRVDDVRELIGWAAMTAQKGGYRVALIHPAEAMNVNAANALLKCLEEPGTSTALILVTDRIHGLLPTIRSRCQHVAFSLPSTQQARQWLGKDLDSTADVDLLLDIHGGNPHLLLVSEEQAFQASRNVLANGLMRLLSDEIAPTELAASLLDYDPMQIICHLQAWLLDVIKHASTGDINFIKNRDLSELLETLDAHMSVLSLYGFLDELVEQKVALLGPSNPSKQLLLASLLSRLSTA